MDRLAGAFKDGCHRMLREPHDLEIGTPLAQRPRDREVALCMAEADRARDVDGTRSLPHRRAHVRLVPAPRAEELREKEVHPHRVAALERMTAADECHELCAGRLSQ